MDAIKTLGEIKEGDFAAAGGKAFNCARLKQAGFAVPDGLVVPGDATAADIESLTNHPWFASMPAGGLFAVRSSGLGEDSEGHSFAGMHDTHLNVRREQVTEAVLACRRSAQSHQARAYRRARSLDRSDTNIAILVQQMVPAVTSGIAFTINPVTGADELVINSAAGTGEALVSGRVTPDQTVLAKNDESELAKLLVRIEQHYGAPQDVEWCHDGAQYWIVQSRPISTTRNPQSIRSPQSAIRDTEWTRANLAEVLPDQLSPQALDLFEPLLERTERRFFGRLMAPESELGPIVKSFHGRLYFNLSQLRRITAFAGAAFADTLRSMGHSEHIRPEDEIATRAPLRDVLRAIPDFARLTWYDFCAPQIFREHEKRTDAVIARLAAVDPSTLPDREIFAIFESWLAVAPETMKAVFVMSSVHFREDFLRKACRAAGVPYAEFVYPQLAAGERSVSSQQAFDLVALAEVARAEPHTAAYLLGNDATCPELRTALAGTRFLDRFDRFLRQYGHRGRYESDWALPRLHEDPAPLLAAVRSHLQSPPQNPEAIAERQEKEAAAAWRAFEEELTWWQRWTLLPRVRSTIRRLKQQYVWREEVRSDLTRVLSRIRAFHLVLANRFVDRGWIDRRDDYFLLRLEEVGRAVADPREGAVLHDIATRRAAQLAVEREFSMPLFMRESELKGLARAVAPQPEGVSPAEELTGLCISTGSVEAEVVVMRDPGEFASMKPGAILVTTATDPSWTPLFTLASGVIVEVGGMLSHASTIAREYGLPALANVKNATKILRTGDRVMLDASGGRVRRIGTRD